MDAKVKVEIPLSGASFGFVMPDIFTVEPPCFYCGKPVDHSQDHFYVDKGAYQIKYWGRGQKFGAPMLGDVVDEKGQKLMGNYELKIPYCPDHITMLKVFSTIDLIAITLGILLGLGLTALAWRAGWYEGGELLIVLFMAPFILVWVLFFIGYLIKSVIAKTSPKYKDYAFGKGHYGIEDQGVSTKGGAEMIGPITYTLALGFFNPVAAKRFIDAYPHAKVTRGQDLLAEKTYAVQG